MCSLLDLFYGQDSKCRICRILLGLSDKKHGILQDINSKPHFHQIFSKAAMLSPTRHFYFLIDNRWFLHWCDHYANWLVQSTYFIWKIWLLSHHWWPQLPQGQIRHIQYVETNSTSHSNGGFEEKVSIFWQKNWQKSDSKIKVFFDRAKVHSRSIFTNHLGLMKINYYTCQHEFFEVSQP